MKRLISILLTLCLLLGVGAWAQEASKLPAPEEVAELENVAEPGESEPASDGEAEDEAAEEANDAASDDSAAAADGMEIPEAEPTATPEAEPTEAPEPIEVWFEEGFGLTLPGGWVSYAVPEEDRENGMRYALGDGTGERNLYIQFKSLNVADVAALSEAVENTEGLTKTGDLSFGDTDFVAFIDSRQNASCCATLWGGDLAVFVFTPQSDSDFMLTASQLMETFRVL